MTPLSTPALTQPKRKPGVQDGRHDFDFLFGAWKVTNRRLAARLKGCTEWQAFPATNEAWPVLGGLGNMDRFRAIFPDGRPLEGMSLRFFDPQTRLWSIYWVDDRAGRLFPPVVGRFTEGLGEFEGAETYEGRPIRVRFRWEVRAADEAHWEQAFSEDEGRTWETNWIMAFTRTGGAL